MISFNAQREKSLVFCGLSLFLLHREISIQYQWFLVLWDVRFLCVGFPQILLRKDPRRWRSRICWNNLGLLGNPITTIPIIFGSVCATTNSKILQLSRWNTRQIARNELHKICLINKASAKKVFRQGFLNKQKARNWGECLSVWLLPHTNTHKYREIMSNTAKPCPWRKSIYCMRCVVAIHPFIVVTLSIAWLVKLFAVFLSFARDGVCTFYPKNYINLHSNNAQTMWLTHEKKKKFYCYWNSCVTSKRRRRRHRTIEWDDKQEIPHRAVHKEH